MIFERLTSMQTVCIERFARWFAYHLSNFKFQWNWADWASALQEDIESPRPKFIREVLQLLLEYSYYQNVVSIVPAEFSIYLPTATGSIFKYAEAGKEATEEQNLDPQFVRAALVAQRLMTALKSRCTPEEANVKLKELSSSPEEGEEEEEEEEEDGSDAREDLPMGDAADDSEEDEEEKELKPKTMTKSERRREYKQNRVKVDVFFTCVLNLGNKSLSHTYALLDK